ncbi:glycosyltransferase [Chitinophaga japonensis]|uniref:Glycosyl transferase family 2 n=1 Tax=Chitinophaga japonensis TaxID=104662 RepID=A0A562SZR4_CHIJA|nr:glycosyltransferase [Chitinophaga japonensis]TWI86779.1 glycosyl transferase family 2 [Chitinophaga japonensis]
MDYSLVVCAYNPDERLLKRCLAAIQRLDKSGMSTEVILVDNNSEVPLKSRPYIQEYMEQITGMQLLMVAEQGVSYARIAAIEAAKGKYIVYFDHDNEPEGDYLQELRTLHEQHPEVAAWGPGKVTVDFIDGIRNDIRQFASGAFQQRNDQEIAFASTPDWQSCYPFGTGLCTEAFLLKKYVQLAQKGHLSLPGRKGNKLSSGEDTQMVLLCIREGYAAGVSPSLRLTHIIPGSRANVSYLKRLIYGTFLCYGASWLQVFPERKTYLQHTIMPRLEFSGRSLKKLVKAKWSRDPHKLFNLVEFIATNAGTYAALNKPVPVLIKGIIKYLKVV